MKIDEKTDQLPKVVCQTCVQQLEAIMDFRKTCKNSQIMLSNLIATINVTQIKPKTAETNNSNQINSQIPIQIQSSPQQPQQQPQQQQQQLQQIHIPAGLQNNDLINSIMQGLQVSQNININ